MGSRNALVQPGEGVGLEYSSIYWRRRWDSARSLREFPAKWTESRVDEPL